VDPALTARHRAACEEVMAATLRDWLPAAEGADPWDRRVARDLARIAGARPWTVRAALDAALADPTAAPACIPALRHLAPAEDNAVPLLLRLLWRPDVRGDAVAALQALGGRAVEARLRSIANSPAAPHAVREACREALAGLALPPEPEPPPPATEAPAGG
jgi:hypothetical protein